MSAICCGHNTTYSFPPPEGLSDPTIVAILAVMIVAVLFLLIWGFWPYFRPGPKARSPTAVAPSEVEMTAVALSEGEMTDVVHSEDDMAFTFQPLNACRRFWG